MRITGKRLRAIIQEELRRSLDEYNCPSLEMTSIKKREFDDATKGATVHKNSNENVDIYVVGDTIYWKFEPAKASALPSRTIYQKGCAAEAPELKKK
jgi:hypothetical protein